MPFGDSSGSFDCAVMLRRWVRGIKGISNQLPLYFESHLTLIAHPRRQATNILAAGCLVYLFLRFLAPTLTWVAPGHLDKSHTFVCQSSRARLYDTIETPAPIDQETISGIWANLEDVFKRCPPKPAELEKVPFEEQSTLPPVDVIRNHTAISEDDTRATRESHVAITKELTPYPQSLFAKKGIVMLAGGKYSGFAPTGLGMLREVGSTLPVELWMKDRGEEKHGWCQELIHEGIACRFLSDYMDVSSLNTGYQYKIFTILFSVFEQVLFLDADNIPIRNPDPIFTSEAFIETGVVLWPDYWKSTSMPELPYIIGLTDGASEILRDEQTVESGQILWDKSRHWKSLLLATYYNYYGPQVYYTLISQGWAGWGDKDTFPMALKSLRQDYRMISLELKTLFVNGTIEGIGMIQADPSNPIDFQPLLIHCNIWKWSVRDFFCTNCPPDEMGKPQSAWEDRQSIIHGHLRSHRRIFNIQDMEAWNIDPEPMLWRSMEHTACRSIWRRGDLCKRVRVHMMKTFGVVFRRGRFMEKCT